MPYNYQKKSSFTLESEVLKEPYNYVFLGLLGLALLCLIILFFTLIFGTGIASFFGWLGVIAALSDLILWLLLIFRIIS